MFELSNDISIKFNTMEQYREVKSKLIENGFEDMSKMSDFNIVKYGLDRFNIHLSGCFFLSNWALRGVNVYDSLEEYLNTLK